MTSTLPSPTPAPVVVAPSPGATSALSDGSHRVVTVGFGSPADAVAWFYVARDPHPGITIVCVGDDPGDLLGMLRHRRRAPNLIVIDARTRLGAATLAASSLRSRGFSGAMLGVVPVRENGGGLAARQLIRAGCNCCTSQTLCPSDLGLLTDLPAEWRAKGSLFAKLIR
ncbi:MAG: hypothetical protein KF745_02825 [Phycisphaeraceae bacterium]|nr:hypothetical protein [Phycisphaeraceae bacterium]